MTRSLFDPHGTADALATGQLRSADPADWPVAAGWQAITSAFFASAQGQQLLAFLRQRLDAGAVIFPPQPLRALQLTPPQAVRLVILGQDPYHGRGQSEGLAFSVPAGVRPPPSLRNIFKELQRDLGPRVAPRSEQDGQLSGWATQGVLLLNTCLTVEEGQPASHAKRGWETLTNALISHVSHGPQPVVFMLWGAHAQSKRELIDTTRHLVLQANHPSPLSALRAPVPFMGCGHFSTALDWLAQQAGASGAADTPSQSLSF